MAMKLGLPSSSRLLLFLKVSGVEILFGGKLIMTIINLVATAKGP